MSYIPLKINGKHLAEIFTPNEVQGFSEEELIQYSYENLMYPTSVTLNVETYSRNAERTANYELGEFYIVNCKAKPEFEWDIIRQEYVAKLLEFVGFTHDFKDDSGEVVPQKAPTIQIEYLDFTGIRTASTYLGQTLDGTFEVMDDVLYVRNFRIAFPER